MKLKKTYSFCVNLGKSIFILITLFVLSTVLISVKEKGNIYYGNRCSATLDNRAINFLKKENLISYDYELNCNTLFLELITENNCSLENHKALLVRIANYYKEINFDINIQITLKNDNYLVLASIVNYEVMLSTTNI
jgi:hypothetical protein